jgi:thiol-disulfide isomerase/thioredoxin
MFYYEYSSGGFHRAYIKALLHNNEEVVVMYGADWCPTCRLVKPILTCLDQAGLIKLVYVDTDKEADDIPKYGVVGSYIPLLSVYKTLSNDQAGLVFVGLPPSKSELIKVLFEDQDVETTLVNYCFKNLNKEEPESL